MQLFERFPTWIDSLQDHEPAEQEPVMALSHAGHSPEDRSDEGRQGGQDEHDMSPDKGEVVDDVECPAHHDPVHH